MSTYFPSVEAARAARKWWVLDATDVPVGRLASAAARLLMGKHRPVFTPHTDTGDFVVVINCEKSVLTGRKESDKMYRRHTGYPGGLEEISAEKLRVRHPTRLVEAAIRGMLPKNRLGRAMSRKLKVYAGPDHPHVSQAPDACDLGAQRREEK